MVECTHEHLVEGYYGHDCAVCGVLVYPYGQELWNVPTEDEQARIDAEEYRATHWTCETCGGEWGDGWSTCRCDDPGGPYCEHCGEELDREECDQCGGEGEFDYETLQEKDPLWYQPGDTERCEQCAGEGYWWLCTNRTCPGKRDGSDHPR